MNTLIDQNQTNTPIKKNLLIGCTGSVATTRIDQIIQSFKPTYNLKIILTKDAKFFSDKIIPNYQEYQSDNNVQFYFDEDEYREYSNNQTVLHIELRKWADAILIAPLSANTLAKITNGLCDNLLTCVIRAWDFTKPGFFALAMNTYMYNHFITEKQVGILEKEFRFVQIPAVVKKLKCGDIGIGGIADTVDVFRIVDDCLKGVKGDS